MSSFSTMAFSESFGPKLVALLGSKACDHRIVQSMINICFGQKPLLAKFCTLETTDQVLPLDQLVSKKHQDGTKLT